MLEVIELIDELKEFINERVAEIDERKEELSQERFKANTEGKLKELILETKGLSGELEGYTNILEFINEKHEI
jgi:ribosomal protein L29